MKIFKRNINLGRKVPVIDSPDLRDKCVTTGKLADGSVTTNKIADGAITREKIADKAITNLDNVVQQVTDALEDINKSEQQIQQNEVERNNTWASWFSDVLPTGVRYLWNAFFSTAQTDVSRVITDAQDTADHPTYVGEDNYVYAWNKQTHSYNKTSIYVRGEGFYISKIFASISDMESYTGTDLKEGDFILIQSTPDDPDNAKLYTYSGTQGVYNFLVDMSGAIGFTGKTPQFSIGSIITIEPTEQASASLSPDGTDSDGNPKYKLNLALPKGAKGTSDFVIVDDHSGAGDDPNKIYIPSANAEKENATAIANEVARATETEQANATAIAAEEARAKAAEQENTTAIAAEETRAKAAEQENATAIGGKQDTIEDLAAIRSGAAAGATAVQPATLDGYYTKSEVDEILRSIAAVAEGYVRVAGSSSPALSYKHYKRDDGDFSAQSVFNIFYPCLVGTPLTGSGTEGKILHVLDKFGAQNDNGVVKWADLKGVLHNIDGSEGDVIICNTEPYYRIMGKRAVNNVVYDVFLMSVQPFRWQGYESEKVEKCGMSPDYCVSHTDSDNVTRMHSVFNPLWEGTRNEVSGCVGKYVYSYDAETGEMVETYDADATLMGDAGGLHTTNLTLPEGEQAAMNNNPDTTKTVPCMNATAAMAENMFAVMLAEGGTFDAHNASIMGSGFCSNDLANTDNDFLASGFDAKNGMRIKDKNDEWQYYGLATSMSFLTGESLHGYNMLNEYANPFRIMEAQRAICYAVKHGVHELEWFAFEGNKYKWRSVDGFLSPTQGEMTCVLWKMFETKAPDTAVDPTDTTTSIAGNRIQLLVSIALYHGVTTQVSPGWWTSGLVFTVDSKRTNKCYMQRDQSKLSVTPDGEKLVDEEWDFEQTYNHVVDVGYGSKYIEDYNNDALMLPESNDAFGGSLHTYVCQHKRFNSGRAPSGKKMVRGFVRGGGVGSSDCSPLMVGAGASPSLAHSYVGFGICYQIVD